MVLLAIVYYCRQPGAKKRERTEKIWSIGIYTGKSPLNLTPPTSITNPVLTAKDVTDAPADFVADPFMVKEGNTWYMFFEVFNSQSEHGDIGLAVSKDGYHWTYRQIVLDKPFHLSYPYVFLWQNEYYLIPESCQADSIQLYRAEEFPTCWTLVKSLLKFLRGNFRVKTLLVVRLHFASTWGTLPLIKDLIQERFPTEVIFFKEKPIMIRK